MSNVSSQFLKSASGPDYSSTNWEEVWQASQQSFDRTLNSVDPQSRPQPFYGLEAGEVIRLYQQLKNSEIESLFDIREKLTHLTKEQIGAVMHLEAIRGHLWTGAHIMAERNQQNLLNGTSIIDKNQRRTERVKEVLTMKELGYTAEDQVKIYNNKKIWTTFTAHPTKDKNEDGERLFRGQTVIAESTPPEQREAAMYSLINKMLVTVVTPQKKDTYRDESKDGIDAQETYNRGMLEYYLDLQYAFDEVYGEGAVDLIDKNMNLDVSPRKWHGGDADGKKIPATSLFNQRVSEAIRGLNFNLEIINSYKSASEEFSKIKATFEQLKIALTVLSEKAGDIEKMPSAGIEFQKIKEQFISAFQTADYNGRTFDSGTALSEKIMDDLRNLRKQKGVSKETRDAAWSMIFLYNQNGIALGRTELRHTGVNIDDIFNNLDDYLTKNRIHAPKKVKPFSELDGEAQASYLHQLVLMYQAQPGKLAEFLIKANEHYEGEPEEKKWLGEIVQRFIMFSQCYNQTKAGAAIVAEAKKTSTLKQQVLAEAVGIKNMFHIALNEDFETIRNAADYLQTYHRHFGNRNRNDRAEQSYASMTPRSDAQKASGPIIAVQQKRTSKKLMEKAIELGMTILEKFGTGAAYPRGAFSSKAVPRMHLNTMRKLKEFLEPAHQKLFSNMASYVSTTTQGRAIGMVCGTPDQVYDLNVGIDTGINAVHAAIHQKINPDIISPEPIKYSRAMKSALKKAEKAALKEYSEVMREQQSRKDGHIGKKRVAMYVDEVGAPTIADFTNVGARPPKKNSGGPSDVTQLRAIGSNNAKAKTETYFDGFYTIGVFLKSLHEDYRKGKITVHDIDDFLEDQFYLQQVFPNAFAALASADFEHGYDQMKKNREVGLHLRVKPVQINPTTGAIRQSIKEDCAGLDDNEAFHTVVAYDAMRITAFMEAMINGTFDKTEREIVEALYDPREKLKRLHFGESTLAYFPDIEGLQNFGVERKLSNAIVHETERRTKLPTGDANRIDTQDETDKAFLHHIATGDRAKGPISIQTVLDQPTSSFAGPIKRVMQTIREQLDTKRNYTTIECRAEI